MTGADGSPATFPTEDTELTHIMVVSDLERSRDWYRDVLGAELVREYGGSSAVFRFGAAWLLVVTGGPPTDDKPDVTFAPPESVAGQPLDHDPGRRTAARPTRLLRDRGADFLTPPYDWGQEIRCFFRDPDGHLFEISQA